MLITIDETDARPIYQQIVDEVRRALVIGTLGADEALPSVRQLAVELRVNPNTVQQAYRELEREGVVYVRRGQGTYASEQQSASTAREQKALARAVAQRALREAYRHGLGAAELIEAIEQSAADVTPNGRKGRA